MIALAIATGIDPNVWIDMGERAIVTAWQLLKDKARAEQGKHYREPDDGPAAQGQADRRARQMSG